MTTPPPPPPQDPYSSNSGAPSSDDKTMALICHFGIILSIWPALLVYLIKGNDSPWVKREAAKAFNFTITFFAAYIALFVVQMVLGAIDSTGFISLATSCVTCLLWPAAIITNIAFGIINGIKTNNGEETKYPFEIPILK